MESNAAVSASIDPGDSESRSPTLVRAARKGGPGHLGGVSVLVVEDDPASAKLVSLLLANEGAVVRIATSAEEALGILAGYRPRLVVLDLLLPRMSGLLLVQEIKAEPWGKEMVMVAVTAMNGPEVERVVQEAGCAGCLAKPIDTDTFAKTVAAHVGGPS